MDNLVRACLKEGFNSARISLRPLIIGDESDMYEYTSDPDTCKYLRWEPHTSITETRSFIAGAIQRCSVANEIVWALVHSGRLVGVVRIYNIDFSASHCEISYVLNKHYSGFGLMTEAVTAAIACCFDRLGLRRVYASYDVKNTKSLRVMERVGMKPVQGFHDVIIKGTLRSLGKCVIESRAED